MAVLFSGLVALPDFLDFKKCAIIIPSAIKSTKTSRRHIRIIGKLFFFFGGLTGGTALLYAVF